MPTLNMSLTSSPNRCIIFVTLSNRITYLVWMCLIWRVVRTGPVMLSNDGNRYPFLLSARHIWIERMNAKIALKYEIKILSTLLRTKIKSIMLICIICMIYKTNKSIFNKNIKFKKITGKIFTSCSIWILSPQMIDFKTFSYY